MSAAIKVLLEALDAYESGRCPETFNALLAAAKVVRETANAAAR